MLGTTALTTRALLENPALIDWSLLPKALMGLLALLCGNGWVGWSFYNYVKHAFFYL